MTEPMTQTVTQPMTQTVTQPTLTQPVSAEAVWAVLEQIEDPELPLTVTDLGLIERVEVDGSRVRVLMVPTFSACPAIEVMRRTIRTRLLALPGVRDAQVDVTFETPWTMARLTPRGRERLRAYGLSVPRRSLHEPAVCPFCGSTNTSLETPFGPTLCRAIYYCRDCRNPIERFKPPAE
jgi:ring-1,2-phenylacetyl-CoA epoxidase subunit PaaD